MRCFSKVGSYWDGMAMAELSRERERAGGWRRQALAGWERRRKKWDEGGGRKGGMRLLPPFLTDCAPKTHAQQTAANPLAR